MNKKLLISIGIAIVVILIAGIVIFMAINNENNIQLDLTAISNEISSKGHFDEMMTMEVETNYLTERMEIPAEQVETVVGKIPMMNVQASMYILIKATDGNANNVKEKIEEFGRQYDEQWARYLPEQYEYVKNRKIGKIGNYVYLIIAENAEELESTIKK